MFNLGLLAIFEKEIYNKQSTIHNYYFSSKYATITFYSQYQFDYWSYRSYILPWKYMVSSGCDTVLNSNTERTNQSEPNAGGLHMVEIAI